MGDSAPKTNTSPPSHSLDRAGRQSVEDWEDWDDDEPRQVMVDGEAPLIATAPENPSKPKTKAARFVQAPVSTVHSTVHHTAQRISRMKSRRRQKAQNAKAGIRLDTDMSKFRPDHIAFHMKAAFDPPQTEIRRGKFLDAAALKALEGEPSSATVGSFHWMKKKPSAKTKSPARRTARTPVDQDLSPDDRPIVIGFALPPGSSQDISPQTAVVESPESPFARYGGNRSQNHLPANTSPLQQQRSAWSPDTEDGCSTFRASIPASSTYSQPTMGARDSNVPPVPALPSSVLEGRRRRTTVITDDQDLGTPVTLFEEDGSPIATRKSPTAKSKVTSNSPLSVRFRGWWDEVTSPFAPSTAVTTSPDDVRDPRLGRGSEWWKTVDVKKPILSMAASAHPVTLQETEVGQESHRGAVVESSPTVASPSLGDRNHSRSESQAEKTQTLAPDESSIPREEPPPYSPPARLQNIRYRAVFPPGHPSNNLYPPSPGPLSPELTRTMTSQGAIGMTDVPLTPPPVGTTSAPLPDRPLGSFVPSEHFLGATGRGPKQKAERQRQRYEKEDAAARKAGGLWRGRGCIPANGCYGRPGREGRKRRRVWFSVIAGLIATTILVVSLAVTLSRRHATDAQPPVNRWLNLTSFPPTPTGVMTVVGPDNPQTVTACVQPSTLWSCSLPKEQARTAAPYQPTQPEFIFQIQFDNSSSHLWDTSSGEIPPRPRGTKIRALAARARALIRGAAQRSESGFVPNPAPPTFQEMWFLGNTTDGIQSDRKGGEPTPFYISLLQSVNETVGPDAILDRRGLYNVSNFPSPERNSDGTGAPARLFPRPTQQPLRLYDRGLPTEHYGFYSHYNKTIYVKSKESLNGSTAGEGEVPADQDGGSLETEANFQVVWGQTRFKVEIWTRKGDATKLLSGDAGGSEQSSRPGDFPYPVTVTLDNHGGDPKHKGIVWYPVDARQDIDSLHLGDENVILYNLGFNGEWINPPATADLSLGGIDGGIGGCKCEYTNFVGV